MRPEFRKSYVGCFVALALSIEEEGKNVSTILILEMNFLTISVNQRNLMPNVFYFARDFERSRPYLYGVHSKGHGFGLCPLLRD